LPLATSRNREGSSDMCARTHVSWRPPSRNSLFPRESECVSHADLLARKFPPRHKLEGAAWQPARTDPPYASYPGIITPSRPVRLPAPPGSYSLHPGTRTTPGQGAAIPRATEETGRRQGDSYLLWRFPPSDISEEPGHRRVIMRLRPAEGMKWTLLRLKHGRGRPWRLGWSGAFPWVLFSASAAREHQYDYEAWADNCGFQFSAARSRRRPLRNSRKSFSGYPARAGGGPSPWTVTLSSEDTGCKAAAMFLEADSAADRLESFFPNSVH